MSFNEAGILKKRANDFLEEAGHLLDIKKYGLAIFNLEQYCDLILKYKMLIKLGYYPRTHSLKELINKLSEFDSNINDLVTNETDLLNIGRLTDAYISARYVPFEFDEKETNNVYKFVVEVFNRYVNRI